MDPPLLEVKQEPIDGNLLADSGGIMERPLYDCHDCDESDDETVVDIEIDNLETWKERMALWVFEATYGEAAPPQLVEFFCGSGDEASEIAKKLSDQVEGIRNKIWEEQLGAASDAEAIRQVELTDMAAGYQMRCAQGLYANARFKDIQGGLYQQLDAALEEVTKSRQNLVDSGKFIAVKGIKIQAKRNRAGAANKGADGFPRKPGLPSQGRKNGVKAVQFEKGKVADTVKAGAKAVKGASALDAVAEQLSCN